MSTLSDDQGGTFEGIVDEYCELVDRYGAGHVIVQRFLEEHAFVEELRVFMESRPIGAGRSALRSAGLRAGLWCISIIALGAVALYAIIAPSDLYDRIALANQQVSDMAGDVAALKTETKTLQTELARAGERVQSLMTAVAEAGTTERSLRGELAQLRHRLEEQPAIPRGVDRERLEEYFAVLTQFKDRQDRIINLLATDQVKRVEGGLFLGDLELAYLPAPDLRIEQPLETALGSSTFLQKVGGVAFEQTARPGRPIDRLTCNYEPAAQDGSRVRVRIDGHPLVIELADWQIIPIAKFADSDYTSCVTLVGDLESAIDQAVVLARDGKVANYHPAFVNTLLGLRLLQLDMLLRHDDACGLPRLKGSEGPVLGHGERPPDKEEGLRAFARLHELREAARFAYVISDADEGVEFHVQDGKLIIRGEPRYFFWSRKVLQVSTLEAGIRAGRRLANELEQEAAARPEFTEAERKNWLIRRIAEESRLLRKSVNPNDLSGFSTRELEVQLANLYRQSVNFEVVAEHDVARETRRRTAEIRAINPAVWDAGVNTMRYAALFRYCKKHDGAAWRDFMKQIREVEVEPRVSTPSVVFDRSRH